MGRLAVFAQLRRHLALGPFVPDLQAFFDIEPVANIAAARVYARPGTVFYLTLAEASRHAETDYVPVVRPQAEPVAGRTLWIRRGPASVEKLDIVWQGAGTDTLHRKAFKVEQTRSTGFGYRVRTARDDEPPDLNAFTVSVPEDSAVGRGIIGGAEQQLRREIVVVHPRRTLLAFLIALVPFGGFLAYRALAGALRWTDCGCMQSFAFSTRKPFTRL